MRKKWLVILNVIVLVIVSVILFFMILKFSVNPEVDESVECIDVNKVASFVYDSCYDAYTKNIFLTVKRGYDTYRLNAFEFSFFDFNQQDYKIIDVPDIDQAKAYKIPAEKNPQNIYVRLDIVKDFSAPICEEPRSLFVKYCPAGIEQESVNVSISPLSGVDLKEFVDIIKSPRQDSDVFSLNLVDKEAIWQSMCESKWLCSKWGKCENGSQKRSCEDSKKCFIPTGVPDETKYCGDICEENWECTWSDCSSGFTIPKCKDLNNCGTLRTIPQKLSCNKEGDCISDISCSGWSECEIDYNFVNLIEGTINEIHGTKFRTCRDLNKCVKANVELRSCSIGIDIYTRRFTKCGTEFIGIYNRLNNELISRIDRGTGESLSLNVYLDSDGESPYCDYCFDGVENGDEEGVDCGGSCRECSDVYKKTTFRKKTWWSGFFDWVKKMLI